MSGERSWWIVAIVVTLLLVGLVAFARGREHRRGDDVGAPSVGVVLLTG